MALTQAQLAAARTRPRTTATMPLTAEQMAAARTSNRTPDAHPLSTAQINASNTQDRSATPIPQSTVTPWSHPSYTGNDATYAAWLAQADLSSRDATSAAKMRKAQAQTAYDQAMQEIMNQAVTGRRDIQTSMLSRGMFRSGETQRRGNEFDSAVDLSKQRALSAETDQFGQADETLRSVMANLGMQGTQQVSQAMLRDSMAQYQAQQAALAQQSAPLPTYAPAAYAPQQQQPYAAPPPHPAPYLPPTTYGSSGPAAPASLFGTPKPKPQKLKLVRSGLQ